MRFIYIRVLKVNKFMSVWSVRTTIFRMAHRVSWYFQHINLETMDVALLWFLQQILIHANHFCSPLSNGTPLIRSTFFFHAIFLCFWFLPQRCFRPSPKKIGSVPKTRALQQQGQQQQTQIKQKTIRQASLIFRHVEFTLAHRRSKWTSSDASNSNVIYRFTMRLMHAC